MKELVRLKVGQLNQQRLLRGLSRTELAKVAGISVPAAMRACRGDEVVLGTGVKLAGALGVDFAELVILDSNGDGAVAGAA